MCREVSSEKAVVWPPFWSSSVPYASSSSFSWCASASYWISDVRCLKPYIGAGRMAFPCGDCPSCRANRRRVWTHRMMLETMCHEYSCWVTLTFDDQHLPEDRSLSPEVLRLWLDRLRKRLKPARFRYFACGEYGERELRPHYHVALFGVRGCAGGPVRQVKGGFECLCKTCLDVRTTWGFGFTSVGELTLKSAMYTTGYVAKKMTRPDNPALSGRYPEFARMSNRPGIGALAIPDVASTILTLNLEKTMVDVPVDLRHGSARMPLGRYLRRELRRQIGRDECAPQAVLDALKTGLLPVYADVEVAFPHARGAFKTLLVQNAVEKMNEQYGRNVVNRQKQRRKL